MDISSLSALGNDPTGISTWLLAHPYVLAIITIWSLIWKGLALWKSSKKNSIIWFIVLLVVNTIGILEILYIFIFSELGKSRQAQAKPTIKKSKRR